MRTLLLAVLALVPAGTLLAQNWVNYRNTTDFFSINLPESVEPEVREITWPSEYGAVFPGRVYAVREGPATYTVTVIDYTDSHNIHLARTNSTEADSPVNYSYWRIDVLASVAYAATQFRGRGGEVTYDAWHHVDRVAGHQLNITNADESRSYVGIYLHDARLYIVEATVPKGYPPQVQFQQSLGFIDEEGRNIRYSWADDGSLIRGTRPR